MSRHLITKTRGPVLRLAAMVITLLAVSCGQRTNAQSMDDRQADRDAIVATALNYAEGWYEGNAERMKAAVHPELAKRAVFPGPGGRQELNQMSAMTLVDNTAGGGGKMTPPEKQLKEVTIFDIYGDVATAKVVMSDWTDFLHLAKWNGEWKIVNVLWELTPEMKERMAAR